MKQIPLQVEVWSAPSEAPVGPARKAESRKWLQPQAAGILGSLLLHSLLLQTLVLGSKAAKLPVKQGVGASASTGSKTPESPPILLQLADSQIGDASLDQEFSSKGMAPKDLPLVIISVDPAPAFANVPDMSEDKEADAVITSGDPEGHARLFG